MSCFYYLVPLNDLSCIHIYPIYTIYDFGPRVEKSALYKLSNPGDVSSSVIKFYYL